MKKRISVILTIIFLLCSTLFAQLHKSKTKSAFLSVLVPGAGEFYSKNKTSGFISLASETILWLGYFGFLEEAKWAERDYKKYASAYSGSNTTKCSDEYYRHLQHYYSSKEYNNNVEIYARYGLYYWSWTIEEYEEFRGKHLYVNDEAWEWESKDIWYRYGELRREKNKFKIMAKFTIGAMIMNRVISMIKAVRSAHSYNKKISSKNSNSFGKFHFGFDPNVHKLTFYFEKKF